MHTSLAHSTASHSNILLYACYCALLTKIVCNIFMKHAHARPIINTHIIAIIISLVPVSEMLISPD